MRIRRRIGGWLVLGVAAAGFLMAPALAETAEESTPQGILEIPLGTVVRADPGSLTVVAEMDVPSELRGRSCDVQSQAENNSSVHADNDLLVASDGVAVELLDVEAAPGKVTISLDRLVLGPTVRVTLRMGPDGVFSAGSTLVVLDCPLPPTTTTTTSTTTSEPPTTTSEPPPSTTTEPPTTTSEPPPSTTTEPPTTSEPPPSTTSEPPPSTSTTTTTEPPSTTTTSTTTTSTPPPTTSPPPPTTTVPPDLPDTGPGSVLLLAGAGIALLDLGYLAVSATWPGRRRRR